MNDESLRVQRHGPNAVELRIPQVIYLSTHPQVDFHGELRIVLTDERAHELRRQLDIACFPLSESAAAS